MNKKLNSINYNSHIKVSNWIQKNLSKANNNKLLLDIATGNGKHSYLAQLKGYTTIATDIDFIKLKNIKSSYIININFETKYNWPFKKNSIDVILVTNYLHRSLLNNILDALKPNGTLLYETFSIENKAFGKPNNPNFLLNPQELYFFAKINKMKIIKYEELISKSPKKKAIQRIYAKKLHSPS